MLGIASQHSIEAFEIDEVAAFSVRWLDNNVVQHDIVLDIRSLILFYFWLWNLSVIYPFSSVLKQNLNLVHLDFCRGDLDWVRLGLEDAYCLVWSPNLGLPRRLLFSIKLINIFGTSLVNLRTYSRKLKFVLVLGKMLLSFFEILELTVPLIFQTQNLWIYFFGNVTIV